MTMNTDYAADETRCGHTGLSEQQVADYLQAQPHFFERNRRLLEQLRLPHHQQGSLSLVEAKMAQQRQRIYDLEDEITELMSVAGENERIFRVYMDLLPTLFECKTAQSLEQQIRHTLQTQLRVPAVRIVLAQANDERELLERLYRERMAGQSVYLGRLSKVEKAALFKGALVGSCALVQLGTRGELGLLAFGSTDSGHYRSGMDTLLIRQLADVLALLLPKLTLVSRVSNG